MSYKDEWAYIIDKVYGFGTMDRGLALSSLDC